MSKKSIVTIICLLLVCVLVVAFPLIFMKDAEFMGTDDQAEQAILNINPDYEPWFESIVNLPEDGAEALMLCLQAAIGAGIIGFTFGYFIARRKIQPVK